MKIYERDCYLVVSLETQTTNLPLVEQGWYHHIGGLQDHSGSVGRVCCRRARPGGGSCRATRFGAGRGDVYEG